MKDILQLGPKGILALDPGEVDRPLTAPEVVYIAKTLGAFWEYDYAAANVGRVGMHAILKSKRHSDGFFVSRILLESDNICRIMADQIVMRLRSESIPCPDCVIGIPDGATKLGRDVAKTLGVRKVEMEKLVGRLVLKDAIPDDASVLLVEDFCTRGTGFKEAVLEVKGKHPSVKVVPYDPVIINRGGLRDFEVEGVGRFTVLPVVERRVQDWEADECLLCPQGSTPIKPKETDANWRLINESQH
ncbi:MAG: phosphoribosyltransferase [Patescibacteria group bacterium]|nr:phosphoribosyltransferase [Patescibacteria group bacterium]